ncbi:helix-turn-helix domain-containing protein [Aureibacillus halotolerans]|nr:helix-turn-helix transcriptional regulator [Aureibacillus halotolerans]
MMVPSNLQRLRLAHNVTRLSMAKSLGITPQAYGNYENGRRQPNLTVLCKLADQFNVTLDELVGRTLQTRTSPSKGHFLHTGQLNENDVSKVSDFIDTLHRQSHYVDQNAVSS